MFLYTYKTLIFAIYYKVMKGKILVNVKASRVKPVDWKIREGYIALPDSRFGDID